MRSSRRIAIRAATCLAMLAAPGHAAAQATAALLPASGSNVHPGILSVANEILKDHIQHTGKFTILNIPGEPTSDEPTAAQAAEVARSNKADVAIVLRITRLQNMARVRLSAYRSADGHVLHWDSMSTGGTPDDLDPVLARLAAGLATGKPVRETADIETVTDKEQEIPNKRTATRTFGLRVGSLFAFDRAGGDNFAAVPGLGIFWMYDARSWLADVGLDYGSSGSSGSSGPADSDDNTCFSIGVGAYYPFRRGDVAPYLGGSVRYAWMDLGGTGGKGLTIQPTAGLLLGRLSNVQIRGEVGYFLNAFAEKERGGVDLPSVNEHFSHGPSLSVGIGF